MLVRALLSLGLLLTMVAWPEDASAYHTGSDFGAPAIEGGGGGIFYVGMPLERGWDCTMCHTDPPGKMELRIDVEPRALFDDFRYQPGAEYAFVARMVWKDGASDLGAASARSNFNALAVGVADDEGIFAGTLQGGGFVSGSGNGTIAFEGLTNAETTFSFRWFAPAEIGRGTIKLYFGAVDGNGADSPPDVTRTDPFGDDVFMAQVTLQEGAPVPDTVGRMSPLGSGDSVTDKREPAGEQEMSFRLVRPSMVLRGATLGKRPPKSAMFAALCLVALFGRRRTSTHNRNDDDE